MVSVRRWDNLWEDSKKMGMNFGKIVRRRVYGLFIIRILRKRGMELW